MKRNGLFIIALGLALCLLVTVAFSLQRPYSWVGIDRGDFTEMQTLWIGTVTYMFVASNTATGNYTDWELVADPDSAVSVWYNEDSYVATDTVHGFFTYTESTANIRAGDRVYSSTDPTNFSAKIIKNDTENDIITYRKWTNATRNLTRMESLFSVKNATVGVSGEPYYSDVNGYITGESRKVMGGEAISPNGRSGDSIYLRAGDPTGTKVYAIFYKQRDRE